MSTAPELDVTPTVPAVLRRAAERFGDRDFVVTPQQRMTFRQAEAASRRLAKELLIAGVGKGTRVGFVYPYGQDWVVVWLAAARIGALCMPFSTVLAPGELRKVVRHGDVDTLVMPDTLSGADVTKLLEEVFPSLAALANPEHVTSHHQIGGVVSHARGEAASESAAPPLRLPEAPYLRSIRLSPTPARRPLPPWATAISTDFADTDEVDGVSDEFLAAVESEVTPSDLMVTIHTSGTTAEPKGVVHTHGTVMRHGANIADAFGRRPDDVVLCATPFFWVGGIGVTLNVALWIGHAVLCLEHFEPAAALDLIEAEGATAVMMWPQLRDRMLQYERDHDRPRSFASLIATSGLGMSETCGHHTVLLLDPAHPLPDELIGSLGTPLQYVQHKIVDAETGADLPPSSVGEICVRGYSVLHGLYKKERHEVFDDDAWYHTGDRGSFRGDVLFFEGRIKTMIKTSGANVAPLEVESVLQTFAEVAQAIVVGVPDKQRGEVVGAVLVPATGHEIDVDDILERAAKELSSYKVPRQVLVLDRDAIPYLATGKPDLLTLREMLAES